MEKYPYVDTIDKFAQIIESIRIMPVPNNFTFRYFFTLGYSSSRDRHFIYLLKFLGFLDQLGKPAPSYFALRDPLKEKEIIASQVCASYKEVFALDENVPNVPESTLYSYFAGQTEAGEQVIKKQIRTFLWLCEFSGIFDMFKNKKEKPSEPRKKGVAPRVSISINIPTTTDDKVYDSLFRHLKELLAPQE